MKGTQRKKWRMEIQRKEDINRCYTKKRQWKKDRERILEKIHRQEDRKGWWIKDNDRKKKKEDRERVERK
jgi:hypothetical protein